MTTHNFHQERCPVTEDRLRHENLQDAQEYLFELCLAHAQTLLGADAYQDELDKLATELMEEME